MSYFILVQKILQGGKCLALIFLQLATLRVHFINKAPVKGYKEHSAVLHSIENVCWTFWKDTTAKLYFRASNLCLEYQYLPHSFHSDYLAWLICLY